MNGRWNHENNLFQQFGLDVDIWATYTKNEPWIESQNEVMIGFISYRWNNLT